MTPNKFINVPFPHPIPREYRHLFIFEQGKRRHEILIAHGRLLTLRQKEAMETRQARDWCAAVMRQIIMDLVPKDKWPPQL